jgi:hypothetical protein
LSTYHVASTGHVLPCVRPLTCVNNPSQGVAGGKTIYQNLIKVLCLNLLLQ